MKKNIQVLKEQPALVRINKVAQNQLKGGGVVEGASVLSVVD